MKSPSDSVIDAATAAIIQGIQAENDLPVTDSDSNTANNPNLCSLDNEIAALDITLAAVQKRLHRRLADTKKRRNAIVPLSKLPVELLIKIFLSELEEVAIKKYYPRIKDLSQVCTAWYSIIHDTANFWTRLHSDFSLPALGRILHKSRNAPLTVECGYLLLNTEAKAFVDMLVPSAKRIHSLTVSRDFVAWTDATKLVGPKLERLEYHASNVSKPLPIGNRVGRLDGLREVVLGSAYLPWSSVSLKALKTLKLSNILSHGPSINQIWSMIQESPSLRSLVLNHVSILPGSSTSETISTINLSSLRQLYLIHLPQNTTQAILNAVRAPRCIDINVSCCFDSATSDALPVLISLSQTIPHIQAALNDGYELSINVTDRVFHCSTGRHRYGSTDEPGIEIELEGIAPYKTLSWLLNLLRPPHDRQATLTLGSGFNISEPSFIYAVDHKLRFVTSLYLATSQSVDPLLKQLGRQVAHNAVPSWPMPRLSILDLGTEYFSGSILLDTLRNRYKGKKAGKKGKGKGTKAASKPVPLTSLVVVGRGSMDEEYQDEVEDILGPGVMDWDMDDEDYDEDYSYDDELDYWDEPYGDHVFGVWD